LAGFGWSSIIYFAAITGIDPHLHKAAVVDGAGQFKRMIYITIPMLMPVISIISVYPLSEKVLPLNKWIKRFMLIQFIIEGGLIPNYLLIKSLGRYNTIGALFIPGMFSTFSVLFILFCRSIF
jgi:ABC-type glycerol-3-phosphate transport system permease component